VAGRRRPVGASSPRWGGGERHHSVGADLVELARTGQSEELSKRRKTHLIDLWQQARSGRGEEHLSSPGPALTLRLSSLGPAWLALLPLLCPFHALAPALAVFLALVLICGSGSAALLAEAQGRPDAVQGVPHPPHPDQGATPGGQRPQVPDDAWEPHRGGVRLSQRATGPAEYWHSPTEVSSKAQNWPQPSEA